MRFPPISYRKDIAQFSNRIRHLRRLPPDCPGLVERERTETVKAVPVDVAFSSFRVNVLAVGKTETAVIVLGVVSAVCSGSSVVSC